MSVEHTVGHFDVIFSNNAKRRNGFRLRHLRSAVNLLSGLDTVIAVTFRVICDRLLF